MSIILEALKKASKEKSGVAQTEKTQEPKTKHLVHPALLIGALVIFVGTVIVSSGLDNSKSTMAVASLKPNIKAEGYSAPTADILKLKPSKQRLTLSGIVLGAGKPTAIIEDEIVEEGSSIKGLKIVKICDDRVDLLNETSGEISTLKVR